MLSKKVRHWFQRDKTDFSGMFSEFSKSLTLIIDLEQLKDNVIARLRDFIDAENIQLYLLNPDLNQYELAESRNNTLIKEKKWHFNPDAPLISWFTVNETYLFLPDNREILSFFSENERTLLNETRTVLIFPLIVMNRVTGIVCIGAKRNGGEYESGEIEMLNTFLGQAAFAFENAYLYRQQKTRLRKMYRADRLATLGQLAAGAAHEIRNPLTSIRSTIQYLERDMENPAKRELVGGLLDEVDRINDIIEGLLSFSKPVKPQRERINMANLINQTISLVSTTARKRDIVITVSHHTDGLNLLADPSQLKQVVLNILMNAVQAIENGGNITVDTTVRKTGDCANDTYIITISDTGPGISHDHLDHIFDPFFTTKKDGTGLGLSISYGIIQQHGGDIEITSTPALENRDDHGTTVTVMLPFMT